MSLVLLYTCLDLPGFPGHYFYYPDVSIYPITPHFHLLVSPGQRNKRARRSVSSSCDLYLRASQVELRFIGLHGHMQCDMLNAEQVVARRRGGRDRRVRGTILICKTS
jgi:hypothetical protein